MSRRYPSTPARGQFTMGSADRLRVIGYPFPGIGHTRPSDRAFTYVPKAIDLS